MAKYVFKGSLSTEGIENIKKQLLKYQQNILPRKIREVVTRLAEIGIPVIEQHMSEASYTYDEKGIQSGSNTEHRTYVDVKSYQDYAIASLVLQGKEILFIEFGSGVSYNTEAGQTPHPMGEKFGYLIGTYGKGNGAKQIWGYYADTGELVLTRGTKATMPMHNADMEIVSQVEKIVREVFS